MPIIGNILNEDKNLRRDIAEKIESTHIKPTIEEQKTAADIIRIISDRFAERLRGRETEELRDELTEAIRKECEGLKIPYEEQKRIEKTVLLTSLGYGPIEEYMRDPDVTDILVQRYDNIVVEKNGKIVKVGAVFNDEQHLVQVIEKIVHRDGKQINISNPEADVKLPDGSRVNATIPPVSVDGATLTIRKFNQKVLSGLDYLKNGSLSREMLYFLERCVRGRMNIFVSGGTGSGKTTLLNMLSAYIPNDEVIITIEDTCELKLQQPNVRRMEQRLANNKDMTNIDFQFLVRTSLRQRPDRIVLGEVRDGSIVDLMTAMSTGHEGSMSTVHANDPKNLFDVRLPLMYSQNREANFSEKTIALQTAEAIQVVVQISRLPDGSRKIVQISHVNGVDESGKVKVNDIFVYNRETGVFEFTGYVPEDILRRFSEKGLDFNREIFTKTTKV